MAVRISRSAQREMKRLQRVDPVGYQMITRMIPDTYEGKGKVLTGTPRDLHGCRALRSGKLRLVYRPGNQPEIVYVGYRRDVYQAQCNN